MGVTAILLRDRIGYCVRSTSTDGQGGYTATYGAASYVRGRFAASDPSEEELGDQLSGRVRATILIDPRGITPKEGDRAVTRDGRTWDVLSVGKTTTPGASASSADLALLAVVEVLGT